MGGRGRSPVATGPEQVFTDLREVAAARTRGTAARESPSPRRNSPPEEQPAGQISQFAQQERDRVL